MSDEDLLGPSELVRKRQASMESPLRKLMLLACPPHPDTGQKSLRYLASLMKMPGASSPMTDEALLKWVRQNSIPPTQAARIVDLAEGRVTISDFSPYYLLENLDP